MFKINFKFIIQTLFYFIIFYSILYVLDIKKNYKKAKVIPKEIALVKEELRASEKNTIEIFRKRSASIVSIKNAVYHRDFFSLNVYEVPKGVGSGVIWDKQGHIITNFHVIYQADKIEVTFSNGISKEAKVIGIAPDYDLAVLKTNLNKQIHQPLPIGSSKDLLVGQNVLALGNPFGLNGTLTKGIISALGRTINSLTGHEIKNVIQTDAAINPGNSGGALLDSYGRLIALNTAILSPSGTSAGVGFAIPVDTVNRISSQLIAYGKLKKVGLGVTLIPDNILINLEIKGAAILEIQKNSPAHKAGLHPTTKDLFGDIILGDIIIKIDSSLIKNNEDLRNILEKKYKNGDIITITFIRNNQILKTEAKLENI